MIMSFSATEKSPWFVEIYQGIKSLVFVKRIQGLLFLPQSQEVENGCFSNLSFLSCKVVFHSTMSMVKRVWTTLLETNTAPENGWLEYDRFPLGPGLFSGVMLVSGSCSWNGPKSDRKIHFCQHEVWKLFPLWCLGGRQVHDALLGNVGL